MVRIIFFISLITLLLYNNIAKIFLLKSQQTLIKSEVKSLIASGSINKEKLSIIKIPAQSESKNVTWLDEDEFLYNDELFDLIEKQVVNDSLFLLARIDNKEMKLIAELKEFISEHLLSFNNENKNSKSSFNFKPIDTDAICENHRYQIISGDDLFYMFKSGSYLNFFYKSISSERAVPPPKYLIHIA